MLSGPEQIRFDELREQLGRRRDDYLRVHASITAICDDFMQMLDTISAESALASEFANGSSASTVLSATDRNAQARERFWTGAADARLTAKELALELGKPKSWVYRHNTRSAERRLPCKKSGGELVFVRGEVRQWLVASEVTVVPGTMPPPAGRLDVAGNQYSGLQRRIRN